MNQLDCLKMFTYWQTIKTKLKDKWRTRKGTEDLNTDLIYKELCHKGDNHSRKVAKGHHLGTHAQYR